MTNLRNSLVSTKNECEPKVSKPKVSCLRPRNRSKAIRSGKFGTNAESVSSRMKHRSKFQVWLAQLHGILEKNMFEEIIGWSKDGSCIEVRDEVRLKKEILGKHLGERSSHKSFKYYLAAVRFLRQPVKKTVCYQHAFLRRGMTL